MPTKRNSNNGVFRKRGAGEWLWIWRVDNETSKKDYLTKTECAMAYITRYVEKNPKYEEMLLDKTWDQIFPIFGITIP